MRAKHRDTMAHRTALLVLVTVLPPVDAASSALANDAAVSLAVKPLTKLVNMLEDMKVELEQSLKDDTKAHDKQECWCKDIPGEDSVQGEVQRISMLSSSISKSKAKSSEVKVKLQEVVKELNADRAALSKAFQIRMREHSAFKAAKNDLLFSIEEITGAMQALGAKPSLAEVRAVSHHLHQLLNPRVSLLLSGGDSENIRQLLQRSQKQPSFLALHMGPEVRQVLTKIKSDFDERLVKEEDDEDAAKQEFESLQTAKKSEMQTGEGLLVKYRAAIAEADQKSTEDAEELKDTEKMLQEKREDIVSMVKTCRTFEDDWQARVKSQMEEVQAVSETIGILQSQTALLSTADSFLQVQAVPNHQVKRERVISLLQLAAGKMRWADVMRLAASVKMDSFTQVKTMIEKLVGELKSQQVADTEQRDWCVEAFHENKLARTAAEDKQESLAAAIANLESDIAVSKSELEGFKEAIQKVTKQQAEATEIRQRENAAFKHAVADHKVMFDVLSKAISRMKQVYVLLEQDQTEATAADDDDAMGAPPARLGEYTKNKGGQKVLSLLTTVLNDDRKALKEAEKNEQDAQGGYDEFMRESTNALARTRKLQVDVTGKKAKLDEDLSLKKTDSKATLTQLQGLYATRGTLHQSCDFLMQNYDTRKQARTQEIEGLGEAISVLSGQH